jgi:small subunit ribosomal protein S8
LRPVLGTVAGSAAGEGRSTGISDYAAYVSEPRRTVGRSPVSSNRAGEIMTDPIADLLARIRNASHRNFEKVDIPSSRLKVGLVRIFKAEGFIANYKVMEDNKKRPYIRIYLKYASARQEVIRGVRRVSRPGLRVYRPYEDFSRRGEAGTISIVSTSKGLLTDRQAFQAKVGGEVLCNIW